MDATDPAAPLFAQIQQLLGEDTEPDPEFFIDSWTLGVATATENYLHRRRQKDNREPKPSSLRPSFTPFIADLCSTEPQLHSGEPSNDESSDDEPMSPVRHPLTLESARRLLGIAGSSTREQIKIAYRQMASRYHPDRLRHATAREQQLATDRMATINEAYRLLSAETRAATRVT
jgi:DnaJ-domain-containing protein 1